MKCRNQKNGRVFVRLCFFLILFISLFCLASAETGGTLEAYGAPGITWNISGNTLTIGGTGTTVPTEAQECWSASFAEDISLIILEDNVSRIESDVFVPLYRVAVVYVTHDQDDFTFDEFSFPDGAEIVYGSVVHTSGLWEYRRLPHDNCIITGYLGTVDDGTDIVCPDDLDGFHVTAFADEVFKGMTFLKSMTLPDDTDTLGKSLFNGCTSLTTVKLGSHAEVLSQQTFFGCRALVDVTLPATLKKVDSYAFGNCTVLKNLSLPDGVTAIESNAFYHCSNLVSLPLPSAVERIGNGAFSGCNSLTSVELPDSLTYLGSRVFSNCSALEELTIGSGLSVITSDSFQGLPSLKMLTLNTNGTTVSSNAFRNCTALQTVTISEATIQSNAFSGDTGLKVFRMQGGTISGTVFSGCTMLEAVTLGENVTSIPSSVFSGLPALKTVVLEGPLSAIPDRAFQNDTALVSVTIPYTVTRIGSYAFSGCTAFAEPDLPMALESIGTYAFSGCVKLTEVVLPSEVRTIESSAFSNCTKLSEITFGEQLLDIGANAFAGCVSMESATLPASVQTVNQGAFPTTTRVYCNPSSAAAKSISRHGGSFVSPDNEEFGIRWLLDPEDETIGLGLSVEQIWTDSDTIAIPEYIGSETVTEIGTSALESCPTVENVTFPASVPSIPNALCKGNNRLVSIVIPAGVTNIGSETFANCEKLNSVSLPDTLTMIGAKAFDGCVLLSEVTLSDNIREIGTDAFSCTKVYANLGTDTAKMLSRTGGGFVCPDYPLLKLKYLFVGGQAASLEVIGAEKTAVTIVIPDSVSSIAAHAFENNTTLQNVTIPESVTLIGAYAFAGSGVKSITLPEGITKIPSYAFYNTSAMTSFTTLGTVTQIGQYAFAGCAVSEISFRSGLARVENYAFSNAVSMISCELPDSVTYLGAYAFDGCRNLTDITIPSGVTEIQSYTFRNTLLLETVGLPAGLTSIGSYAFYKSGLASVSIPGTVKTIGSYAFEYCNGLKTVTMDGNMTSIGICAFYQCGNLETVTMPDMLQTMGSEAFNRCEKLKEIILPDGLNTIPEYAFSGCSALTHLKVGDGTVEIGNSSFASCAALKSVELPNTLVRIGNSAFNNCSALNLITFPNSVTTIGQEAFYGCRSLTSVSLPDSVASLGNGAFSACSKVGSIRLSSGLVSIPGNAFSYCTALTSVAIPDGVRSIGAGAFLQDSNLKAVSIAASVTSIDSTAFNYIAPAQLTVYCYQNSEADTFAKSKGFTVIYLDGANALANVTLTPASTDAIFISPGDTLEHLGDLFTIEPTNLPFQLTLSFSTDDPSTAAVSADVLTGIAVGDTILRVTIQENSNLTASIPVYVREKLTDFTLESPVWLHRDSTLTLLPESSVPAGITDGYVWEIDRALGQIENGVLTPTAFGTGELTATSWNGISRTAVIHIYEDPTEITFTGVPAGMDIGMKTTLQPKVKAGTIFTGDEALHFISYRSSDESIATVDATGLVTAVGYGTAVIYAEADNGCTGTADIYVSPPITGFNLRGNMRVPIGVTVDLAVTEVEPENANLNAFSWSVTPEGLAEYHNGKITILTDQECEVHITATSWNGLSQETDLYIYRPAVESVAIQDINPWNILPSYSDIQLTAVVQATSTFTNQLITWKLGDDYSYGASINQDGMLHTGDGYADLYVTAEADNGVKDTKCFIVRSPIQDFSLAERYAVQTGETVTVSPSAGGEYYTLSVGTPELAEVDGMKIKGLKPGKTELTVTSWNGVSRKAQVLVYDPIEEIRITDIESLNGKVSASDPMRHIFATMNFRAHSEAVSDRVYTDDLVTWSSSNPNVVRVTNAKTGEFRTVTFGDAVLTATAANGTVGSIELHVYQEVDSFRLPDKITAYILAEQKLEAASFLPEEAYDGFVWEVVPSSIGTVEGQTLKVRAEQPTTGKLICTSWDGFITHETDLEIISAPVTAVSLDLPEDGTVEVDGVYSLKAHVTAGTEYTNEFVVWSTDNDQVATVDDRGNLTVLSEGTVTVTAAAADDPSISDSITLEAVQGVYAFTVPETITIFPDETAAIEITDIEPSAAAGRPFFFTSGDESVVTVENGVIQPQQWEDGVTTVTVSSWNGVSRTIRVTVKKPVVRSVSVDWDNLNLVIGEKRQLHATVLLEDGQSFDNRFVTWESSTDYPDVVSIDENGLVSARANGSSWIYVRSWDNAWSDSHSVYVDNISRLSGKGDTVIRLGDETAISALFSGWTNRYDPEYGYHRDIEIPGDQLPLVYSSSDESILTVDESGMITGLAKGTVTVTASFEPANLMAEVTVSVVRDVVSFDLPGRVKVPLGGKEVELSVLNIGPEGTDASDLIWTVEPAELAVVENGKITSKVKEAAEGTIIARNISGTVERSAKLVIYSPWVDRIEFEPMDYVPAYRDVELKAHVYAGDEEYLNQLVTFKAYWDEALTNECEMGTSFRETGIINYYGTGTFYIVAKAQNDVQAVMQIRFYPEFDDFELEDTVYLMPNSDGRIGVTNYRSGNPNYYGDSMYSSPNYLIWQKDASAPFELSSDGYIFYYYYDYEDESGSGPQTGVYTVTAASVNGVTRTSRVAVYREEDIKGVSIAPLKTNYLVYESFNLQALISLYGEDLPGNQFVTWSSSAPDVISVTASGMARAKDIGTATLTAVTQNGYTASVTLTVRPEIDNFTLPVQFEVTYGQSIVLDYESAEPADAVMEINWEVIPADAAVIEGNLLTPAVNEDRTVQIKAVNWDGTTRTAALVIHRNKKLGISLKLPEGLTEIGDEAFEGTGAEVVIVPESCVTIGSRAFANAVKLEEIYIPFGVAEIADDAFAGIEGQITIFCQPGSYAEGYAESKGISHAPIEQ